jgi:hypothetical protein
MIQNSNNSFQTVTNVRFGAKDLEDLWWNAQSFELPTITLTVPQNNTRAGALVSQGTDTVNYSDFSVQVILDKEWKVFDELYQYFVEGVNVETGKFAHNKKFELWVEFTNSNNEIYKKFFLHSCRLLDFGGIRVDTTSAEDDLQVLTLSFNILYYSYE